MALGTRPARAARRGGRPWLFFALLATVLVIVVNAAMSARSPAPARQEAEQSYLDQALPAIQQSSQQGLDINDVLAQALSLSPGTIANHINEDVSQSEQTMNTVEKLDPPPAMKVAQALLVAALDIRTTGTKALGQAIGTALSGQPTTTGVNALANVGLDFQAADRAYSLFQQAMPRQGVPIPNSVWVTNAGSYSTATLTVFVNSLRAHGSLTPISDVSVILVTSNPAPVNLVNGVQILPIAHTLSLQIVVADIGNQPEANLMVTASIAPSSIGPTQNVRQFVDLAPGQTRTVDLGGLHLLADQVTTLTARIDTVPGETDITDNSKVITMEMQ
jgi:hypothetical protein